MLSRTSLALLCIIGTISAFVIQPSRVAAPVKIQAFPNRWSEFTTVAALTALTTPLVAIAEAVDDYEYGAVNAPIGKFLNIVFMFFANETNL
jgi:hypothetical protein